MHILHAYPCSHPFSHKLKCTYMYIPLPHISTSMLSFTRQFSTSLGFDWLMLFMDASIHAETVSRAVRILIQLLTDSILRVKFHEGDIFGGWVQGFESISSDMSQMLSTSVSHFNPLKPSTNSQLSGASALSYILPHHAHLSHVFLLLVASLLGKSSTDIPFSSQFNTETLEDLFSIGDTTNMAQQFKIFTDAAYVLLALTRSLLHQVCAVAYNKYNSVSTSLIYTKISRVHTEVGGGRGAVGYPPQCS